MNFIHEFISQFENQILSNCILLHGFSKSTLTLTAFLLAEIILKKSERNKFGLNETDVRRYLISGLHPNFFELRKAPLEQFIKIEFVREMMNFVQFSPMIPGVRVILIDGAENLNQSSGNAMIKILEDSSESIFFILTTVNVNSVLKTILSRLQKFFIKNDSINNFDSSFVSAYKRKFDSEELHEENKNLEYAKSILNEFFEKFVIDFDKKDSSENKNQKENSSINNIELYLKLMRNLSSFLRHGIPEAHIHSYINSFKKIDFNY